VDACILFEGETALPALIEEWQSGRSGCNAPNVLMARGREVVISEKVHTEDLEALPPPDHTGLDLSRYWWPEPALLVNSSRGCYYGRCAFCTISPATWGPERAGRSYRMRSPEKIVEDLRFIHGQTSARAFNLANDVLPPRALSEIGELLRSEPLGITWDSEIRMERGLSRPILQTMADSGCRHLRFGFETASSRVAKLMDKGIDPAAADRILRDCRDTGISVSLLCQIGLPGESVDEARETLRFLERSRDMVAFVSLSQFALERGSKIEQQPSSFGVRLRPVPAGLDLAWTYDYVRSDGIDVAQTSVQFDQIEAALDATYPDRDLFFKGGLGHAHTTLYTRRYSPAVFLDWNRHGLRSPKVFESVRTLRSARRLLVRAVDGNDGGNWSPVLVSSAEVPELMVKMDGRLLLVLLAGESGISVETLKSWVAFLFGGSEAGEIVNMLYEAGMLLSLTGDSRIVPLLDRPHPHPVAISSRELLPA
jgi:hypothetical protein